MPIREDFVDLRTPTGSMRIHRFQPTAGGSYSGLVFFFEKCDASHAFIPVTSSQQQQPASAVPPKLG